MSRGGARQFAAGRVAEEVVVARARLRDILGEGPELQAGVQEAEVMPSWRAGARAAVGGGLLLLGLTAVCAGQDAPATVAAWASARARPLAAVELGNGFGDLDLLKRVIGSARVVSLGEGMHGAHDFLAFRNRMFEFLAEELGFTAIALETGFTESVAADEYVQGRGSATAGVINAAFSWSANAFAENRQLLDWMRAYNAKPSTKRPLRFYGLDLAGARLGRFPNARKAVDDALTYVTSVDSAQAANLRGRIEPLLGRFNSDGYDSLPAQSRDRLSAAIQDLVSLFERRHVVWLEQTSALAYHRAHRNAVIARHLDANFREASQTNPKRYQIQRGAAMADNVRWILEREGPQGRLLIFAHNTHVRKGPAETGPTSLGQRLAEGLGKSMVVIGSLYYEGGIEVVGDSVMILPPAEPATFNATLAHAVAAPMFALDLSTLPRSKPVADWLANGKALRHGFFEGDPTVSFDALVFIKTIQPLRVLR